MLPLRELPLSVFPLSGVGCGVATGRLYLHIICGFLFVSFSRQQKGYLIFGQAFVARMPKKRQISHFFNKCFISGWVRINLVLYAFVTGESEFKTRNKTRTRYEPFTHECCSRLYMRRQHMFVLKLDSLTHSFTHQVLVFLQHLIFVRFMSFSKKYLTNRETFTLCGSKKEGEDETRREGFFHVNKWLTCERRLEATTGNTFAFAG